jgi:hypothetical protein
MAFQAEKAFDLQPDYASSQNIVDDIKLGVAVTAEGTVPVFADDAVPDSQVSFEMTQAGEEADVWDDARNFAPPTNYNVPDPFKSNAAVIIRRGHSAPVR